MNLNFLSALGGAASGIGEGLMYRRERQRQEQMDALDKRLREIQMAGLGTQNEMGVFQLEEARRQAQRQRGIEAFQQTPISDLVQPSLPEGGNLRDLLARYPAGPARSGTMHQALGQVIPPEMQGLSLEQIGLLQPVIQGLQEQRKGAGDLAYQEAVQNYALGGLSGPEAALSGLPEGSPRMSLQTLSPLIQESLQQRGLGERAAAGSAAQQELERIRQAGKMIPGFGDVTKAASERANLMQDMSNEIAVRIAAANGVKMDDLYGDVMSGGKFQIEKLISRFTPQQYAEYRDTLAQEADALFGNMGMGGGEEGGVGGEGGGDGTQGAPGGGAPSPAGQAPPPGVGSDVERDILEQFPWMVRSATWNDPEKKMILLRAVAKGMKPYEAWRSIEGQ